MIDTNKIKEDFPIFKRKFNGKELVYLDNAATTQKPQDVIRAITEFYENHNANVHRGIHTLSEEASDMFESSRKKVQNFIGAASPEEVIFTLNSTDSLNLIAYGWALSHLEKDDEIVISDMEHHSNFVPWQQLTLEKGAKMVFMESAKYGNEGDAHLLREKINERVKIVVVSHASNVTGRINPIKEISKITKSVGAILVVDGAQAVPNISVNVQSLGCDFYVFSAHKMLGPTGVGILWGRKELLESMNPYRYGGGMISTVSEESSTWADLPDRLEGGTPNIADVIGFGAAIDYINKVGIDNIREHEVELSNYALKELKKINGLYILGSTDAEKRTGLVSFHVDGMHSHDIAAILNTKGVAVRSGHHCAMPLHTKLNVSSSTRASYYLYNTKKDIDALISAIKKAEKILK